MEDRKIAVTIERVKDYEFRVLFDPGVPELMVDEAPPLGQGRGPSPARVLATAVGSCLCASLLFCLKKMRVEPRRIGATVSNTVERNEAGRLRIAEQNVRITLDLDPAAGPVDRCLELFEEFCTVTASVRSGIRVNVEVVDGEGKEILRSSGPGR